MINHWVKTFLLITHLLTHLLKNGSSKRNGLFPRTKHRPEWGTGSLYRNPRTHTKTPSLFCPRKEFAICFRSTTLASSRSSVNGKVYYTKSFLSRPLFEPSCLSGLFLSQENKWHCSGKMALASKTESEEGHSFFLKMEDAFLFPGAFRRPL